MSTIEPYGQLLVGLLYRLKMDLAGLVLPDNITTGFVNDEMLTMMRANKPGQSPRVIVSLGASTTTQLPAGGGARYSETAPIAGNGNLPSTIMRMSETARMSTQVIIYVLAGGMMGQRLRSLVAQAVKQSLSTKRPGSGRRLDYIYLRIPDSLDNAPAKRVGDTSVPVSYNALGQEISTWIPEHDLFGLTVTLLLKGERYYDAQDKNQLFRQDLTYLAYHSEYDLFAMPVVERIAASVVVQIGQ